MGQTPLLFPFYILWFVVFYFLWHYEQRKETKPILLKTTLFVAVTSLSFTPQWNMMAFFPTSSDRWRKNASCGECLCGLLKTNPWPQHCFNHTSDIMWSSADCERKSSTRRMLTDVTPDDREQWLSAFHIGSFPFLIIAAHTILLEETTCIWTLTSYLFVDNFTPKFHRHIVIYQCCMIF